MLTFFLMVLSTYLFAVLGFVFFWNYYSNYTLQCSTLFQCTLSAIAEGFKSDGIADLLTSQIETLGFPKHLWSDWSLLLLIVWNLGFFLMVVLILVAVFTGIIIDSFGELRDKQHARDEQLTSSCVICNIPMDRFVQCPGASFELHTAETHNVLAYLCYFLHLKSKQNEESTPQEKYMQSCIFPESGQESIRFFPNPSTKTMDLRNETRSDREDLLEAKISTCLQDLSDVKQMVSSIENDGIRSTSSDNPPNRRRRSLNPMFSESLERTFDTIQ